jgi:hypothetical protein
MRRPDVDLEAFSADPLTYSSQRGNPLYSAEGE